MSLLLAFPIRVLWLINANGKVSPTKRDTITGARMSSKRDERAKKKRMNVESGITFTPSTCVTLKMFVEKGPGASILGEKLIPRKEKIISAAGKRVIKNPPPIIMKFLTLFFGSMSFFPISWEKIFRDSNVKYPKTRSGMTMRNESVGFTRKMRLANKRINEMGLVSFEIVYGSSL